MRNVFSPRTPLSTSQLIRWENGKIIVMSPFVKGGNIKVDEKWVAAPIEAYADLAEMKRQIEQRWRVPDHTVKSGRMEQGKCFDS